eukprot:Lankesteria_metandrocarpae@DN10907_c0_g1_i1.p1
MMSPEAHVCKIGSSDGLSPSFLKKRAGELKSIRLAVDIWPTVAMLHFREVDTLWQLVHLPWLAMQRYLKWVDLDSVLSVDSSDTVKSPSVGRVESSRPADDGSGNGMCGSDTATWHMCIGYSSRLHWNTSSVGGSTKSDFELNCPLPAKNHFVASFGTAYSVHGHCTGNLNTMAGASKGTAQNAVGMRRVNKNGSCTAPRACSLSRTDLRDSSTNTVANVIRQNVKSDISSLIDALVESSEYLPRGEMPNLGSASALPSFCGDYVTGLDSVLHNLDADLIESMSLSQFAVCSLDRLSGKLSVCRGGELKYIMVLRRRFDRKFIKSFLKGIRPTSEEKLQSGRNICRSFLRKVVWSSARDIKQREDAK